MKTIIAIIASLVIINTANATALPITFDDVVYEGVVNMEASLGFGASKLLQVIQDNKEVYNELSAMSYKAPMVSVVGKPETETHYSIREFHFKVYQQIPSYFGSKNGKLLGHVVITSKIDKRIMDAAPTEYEVKKMIFKK